MNTPTLYEWAGGREQFENLTELFYAKVSKDDLLAPVFKNMSAVHTKHVAHLAEWGSRIAVINSNTTTSEVNEDALMPKSGWCETGGSYIVAALAKAGDCC